MASASGGGTWANRAGNGASPTWLEMHLFRDNETTSFTISDDELATILYSRFNFGEFDIVQIDHASMKLIRILVRAGVNVNNHKNDSAYQVRPGLYILPMKEMKQEKIVKLSWLPEEVTNDQVCEVLELFGTVTKTPVNMKYAIKDNAPALTKRLRNVLSNDRKVEMIIERNIPSYIKIQERKVKVWYQGQNFSCARCYKPFRQCPGRAIAKDCQKNKGKKEENLLRMKSKL